MKKLIYMIAAAAVAIPVVALAQGACGSGSCSKGDKDMAEAKEHMKEGAKAAKDAASEKWRKAGRLPGTPMKRARKPPGMLIRTAGTPLTMRRTGLPIRSKPSVTL